VTPVMLGIPFFGPYIVSNYFLKVIHIIYTEDFRETVVIFLVDPKDSLMEMIIPKLSFDFFTRKANV
jgi:hypothetical protein